MTKELERAFREASKLPEPEQNALAAAIRSEITGDEDWDKAFEASQDALEELADEAVAEHRADYTQPIASRKK